MVYIRTLIRNSYVKSRADSDVFWRTALTEARRVNAHICRFSRILGCKTTQHVLDAPLYLHQIRKCIGEDDVF